MNADGSNQINLSNNAADDSEPSWSPDGAKITFTRDDEIYIMDADGANQIALTSGQGRNAQPAWKP